MTIQPPNNSNSTDYLLGRVLAELQPPQSPLATDALANDPVAWIEKHFRIPETPDHLLRLGDYQKFVLRQALTRDPVTGHFPYSVVVWSDIKKSIKSTVAAAVALWRAYTTPWASIKIVANDLKQADSRVSYYLRRAIELHPIMKKEVKIRPSGYTVLFPNHARIEAIPVDPKGEAGGNDDLIVFSELWAANSVAASRMWTEMTLSPTKFGLSFRWVETYAGHYGEAPLLEQLYQAGVEQGTQVPGYSQFNPPLPLYENLEGRLLCLWNDTPRLPWQTPEYYAQEQAILAPSEFDRVHRNQWASSTQIFIPPEWWRGCTLPFEPPMGISDSCILSVDAAVDDDSFGILLLSGTPDLKNARNENPRLPDSSNPNDPAPSTVTQQRPSFTQTNYGQYDWYSANPLTRNKGILRSPSNNPDANGNDDLPTVRHSPLGLSFVNLPPKQPQPQQGVSEDEFFHSLLNGTLTDHYYVRFTTALTPHSRGGHVSFADAEATIRRLIEQYNVVEMCYDPYMLEDMAQRFRAEGLVHLHAFKQTTPRLVADKMLYDVIRDRRVHARDSHEILKTHLLNADAKYEGDKLRIVKRNNADKIDLAVCLSMAVSRAVYWRI